MPGRRIALTREVSRTVNRCELTHRARAPIDLARARTQHREYEDALRSLGVEVIRLPELPEQPDAVFVEDGAVVLEEIAVLTRPGAASRRPEVASLEDALRPHRPLARIEAPATLDGGDVLRVDRTLYVGASTRTTSAGAAALEAVAARFGYRVAAVPVTGCLHLKSAATEVGPRVLLVHPGWVDPAAFAGCGIVEADPGEPGAANALRIGETVIVDAAHVRTRERLEDAGVATLPVPMDELARAEGGVTCCSLVFPATAPDSGRERPG